MGTNGKKAVMPSVLIPEKATDPICVVKGEASISFNVNISDQAEFTAFALDLDSRSKALDSLYQCRALIRKGQVHLKNAAENLYQLEQELKTANRMLIDTAQTFWGFTSLREDKESLDILQRDLFGKEGGNAYLKLITDCIAMLILSEEERKNSSRARTEPSLPEPLKTAIGADSSSSKKTEESPESVSSPNK